MTPLFYLQIYPKPISFTNMHVLDLIYLQFLSEKTRTTVSLQLHGRTSSAPRSLTTSKSTVKQKLGILGEKNTSMAKHAYSCMKKKTKFGANLSIWKIRGKNDRGLVRPRSFVVFEVMHAYKSLTFYTLHLIYKIKRKAQNRSFFQKFLYYDTSLLSLYLGRAVDIP